MKLSNSLVLQTESAEEKQKLDMVLSIVRNTLALTSNMPTLTWKEISLGEETATFICAPEAQMNIVKLNLQVLGVNFNRTSFAVEYHAPVMPSVAPSQANEVNTVAQTVVATTAPSTDEEIPLVSTVASTPVVENTEPTVVSNHIEYEDGDDPNQDTSDNCYAETSQFSLSDELPFDLVAARQDYDIHLNGISYYNQSATATALLDDGSPDTAMRRHLAQEDRALVAVWANQEAMPQEDRIQWQCAYTRLTESPNPTQSASGTITIQEQLDYDANNNPRRWNLVKTSVNGTHLTYLCPPSVDLDSTIRILGGRHANMHPDIYDICVWNTEPYWRELRHLMHNPSVQFLRETIAA